MKKREKISLFNIPLKENFRTLFEYFTGSFGSPNVIFSIVSNREELNFPISRIKIHICCAIRGGIAAPSGWNLWISCAERRNTLQHHKSENFLVRDAVS